MTEAELELRALIFRALDSSTSLLHSLRQGRDLYWLRGQEGFSEEVTFEIVLKGWHQDWV